MTEVDALAHQFFQKGWVNFPADPSITAWALSAAPLAAEALETPALRDRWLRSGGTWFVGVNALTNDSSGAIPERGVPPLAGPPIAFAAHQLGLGGFEWDRAQISICLPGYPQPDPEETDSAYKFRLNRDAAHVDGLLRDGNRRRRLGERHAFILGIPLARAQPGESPFVVYEGSHEIMRQAFTERFQGIDPADWEDEDVTETYVAARREAFATCRRAEINVRPGEAYIAHRLALHGIAPWQEPPGGSKPDARRMIAYFRPDPFPGQSPAWWLERP